LLAIVVWAGPVIAVMVMNPGSVEVSHVSPPPSTPVIGRIGRRTEDGSQAATLSFTWSTPPDLPWVGSGGIVSDVAPRSTATIEDGEYLLAVAGRPVFAKTAGAPIVRDLTIGDAGPDVTWLDHVLMRNGFAAKTTLDGRGRFTTRTGLALHDMRLAHGEIDPDRSLHLDDIAFVPAAYATGAIVPTLGLRIETGGRFISLPMQLTAASITLTGPPDQQSLVRDTDLILHVGEVDVPVRALRLTDDELKELSAALGDSPASGPQSIDVTVRRKTDLEVATVPSTAILLSADGSRACLAIVDDTRTRVQRLGGAPLAAAAEPGVSYLDADLAGTSVLENPGTARPDLTCD
jgi:hypothetical protein